MGAGSTNIAQPWRNEVYLTVRDWPHPVLAHEVAHVVAGNAADGPFQVGGHLGGYLPNPALIEGVAVAAAWASNDALTPHQWAKAMLELDKLPPLDAVFGLSFLTQPSRHAYTAAGSFIRFVHEEHGPEAVRALHRTGDVEGSVGASLSDLEERWHAFLGERPLPDDALALARVRFDQRSIFSAVCPRQVAQLRQELSRDRAAGAPQRVRETCEEILDIDPTSLRERAALVGALARLGRFDDAKAELGKLETTYDAPVPITSAARESLADAYWRRGKSGRARSIYEELLGKPQPESRARALEVKRLALAAGGSQAALVRDLLVPGADGPVSGALAVHFARELRQAREDGLGAYLEARQLQHRDRYERALPLIQAAGRKGLPTPRLEKERQRMLGIALYATGRFDDSAALFHSWLADDSTTAARRALARDWLERIAYRNKARPERASGS